MKAQLEFNLPEEISDLKLMLKANDYHLCLWDFDQWLRNEIKYQGKDLDEVREMLHSIINNYNINLDD